MKLLHTADWHLGNTFHGHDRADEHRHFLNWLQTTVEREKPDALLIAGDVYDNANPSASAQALFYDFLESVTAACPDLQVVVIAGNHDSASRIEAPSALLERHRIFVRGIVGRDAKGNPDYSRLCIPLHGADGSEVCCLAVPYLRGADCRAAATQGEAVRAFLAEAVAAAGTRVPLVVVAHFYAVGAEICSDEHSERLVVGGLDCVDASDLGRGPAYVALGHIHRAQCVAGSDTVRYAGSVLPLSFSERHYRHGVLRVVLSPDAPAVVDTLEYEPQRGLLSIPAKGAAATAEEVFDEIRRLPRADKHDDGACWPYLEIKIREERPDPSLPRQLLDALADRAVRFCRMERVRDEKTDASEVLPVASVEGLKRMTPLDMVRQVYRNRYDCDMPADLVALFEEAQEKMTEE